MAFQHVDLSSQRLIDRTSSDCTIIQTYCGHLLAELSNFFALSHNKVNYEVAFTADDNLVSDISTPYGVARGRLTILLEDQVISGRYVFEKSVVSAEGSEIWTPVWAIRITRSGNVLLGDEGGVEIDVANVGPHSNAMSAPAKTLLYSIASKPIFNS